MNFVPKLCYKGACELYAYPSDVTMLQYKFFYGSNQEKSQLKSTEEGAHFSLRMKKFCMGQMTTIELVFIKEKITIVKIIILLLLLCNYTHGYKLLL